MTVAKQALAGLRADDLRVMAARALRLATVEDIEQEVLAVVDAPAEHRGVTP
jgi:hypothetical protein